MSSQNSPRRIAYMLRKIREKDIYKDRKKPRPLRLHTRGVFELPDGRGAVTVNGTVYASKELTGIIGDVAWVRCRPGWGGVAFDEFNHPLWKLEEVPALGG